jgi:C1A family cysteine protease
MLAVGWGEFDTKINILNITTHYYITVKNSFGTSWGSNGYAKIVYKTLKKQNSFLKDFNDVNSCGLLGDPYFPYE